MKPDLERFKRDLERSAEHYRYDIEVREEGTVSAVGDGVARISGLSHVRLDELVDIEGGATGLCLDLGTDDVGVVLVTGGESVRAGARVQGTGQVASVSVGDALLGRVVDPLGRPIDGGDAPQTDARWPVERPAPGIVDRQPVVEPLLTGIMAIDALFPVGRGQRQLIVGDLGSGKSTIATDAVINQTGTSIRCVYVVIGQKTSAVMSLLDSLRRHGALDHTVVVVAGADAPAGLRYLAPYAGCSIAEYFRDRGEDALVVFDDLSRHAIAYREIALLLGRPPGREAYPGDIFFIHSRLLERATHLVAAKGGGSLTALPIVETQTGRISDFIPTNLISITDGQLYLDPLLFDRGIKPAIDVGLSVSRVGGKTQRTSMKVVAGRLRLDLARYHEVEVFARFGTRLEESTRQLLTRGDRSREVLKQGPGTPVPLGEQVALLAALEEGLFDALAVTEVAATASELRATLRRQHPDLLRRLELGTPPTPDDIRLVREAMGAEDMGAEALA